MPVPDLPDLPEGDSLVHRREACRIYVRWVRDLLNSFLHGSQYDDLFVPHVRELGRGAWAEIERSWRARPCWTVSHGTSVEALRLRRDLTMARCGGTFLRTCEQGL